MSADHGRKLEASLKSSDVPMLGTPPRALVLHGFTGNRETVRILGPMCEARGIEFAMPHLRGHGTRPEDLLGVTWRDWYEDAEKELFELTTDGSPAIVMGLSMGGLVALDLASRHPERVCGIVTIAAALELLSPLLVLLPLVARTTTWWKGKPEGSREIVAAYERFPVSGLQSLIEYQSVVRDRLPLVKAPLLVVQSWRDPTVKPRAARTIYDRVGSRDKELARFQESLHDMLIGSECNEVCARIGSWIDARLPQWRKA